MASGNEGKPGSTVPKAEFTVSYPAVAARQTVATPHTTSIKE
jgi:hypothetical protein